MSAYWKSEWTKLEYRRVGECLNMWRESHTRLTPAGVVTKGDKMKVREIMSIIEQDGWYLVATRGDHRQYKHTTKKGRVTVPGKVNSDVAPGTLASIYKQAKIVRGK